MWRMVSCMRFGGRLFHTTPSIASLLPNISLTGSHLRSRGVSVPTPSHRIIRCPYPDIHIPNVSLPVLVWERMGQWQDKQALTCGITRRTYTYAQARDASRKFGIALLKRGLRTGDVVALCMPNIPEYPLAYLGALEAGLALTTINPLFTEDEMSMQLQNSKPKAIVTTPELIAKSRKAMTNVPNCQTFITIVDGTTIHTAGCLSFAELVNQPPDISLSFPYIEPEDLAVIPYTNGTTGSPKGVKLSHCNLVTNVMQISHEAFDQGREATESFQEVIVAVIPLYHIYGMIVVMLARMCLGAHIITVPDPEPEIYLTCLSQYRSTVLNITTSLMHFLASFKNINSSLLEHVHTVMYGGSPMSPDNVATFMARMKPSVVFQQGYGMTETTAAITQTSRWERKLGTSGYLVPNTQAKVVDLATGVALGSGHTGEIRVKGPQVMMSYLNDDAAMLKKIDQEGWLCTGDLGFYDDEHCFHIVDRLEELISVTRMHTLSVSPAEIENLLRGHPGVDEAAVVGIPDMTAGEVPRAFVVRRPSFLRLTEQELLDLVCQNLPPYKGLAGGIKFVDSLPKTPTDESRNSTSTKILHLNS